MHRAAFLRVCHSIFQISRLGPSLLSRSEAEIPEAHHMTSQNGGRSVYNQRGGRRW